MQDMIIWKGWGVLTLLVLALCYGVAVLFLGDNNHWSSIVAYLIAAPLTWLLGCRLGPGHDLFFMRVQWWACVFGGIGMLLLISELIGTP